MEIDMLWWCGAFADDAGLVWIKSCGIDEWWPVSNLQWKDVVFLKRT